MEKLKNTRWLALIGLILCFLGNTLPYLIYTMPYAKITIKTKLCTYWEGKIIFILILANLLFIFKDYVKKYMPKLFDSNMGKWILNADSKLTFLPTLGIALFAIWIFPNIDMNWNIVKYGIGFYALWLGIILLVIHQFIYRPTKESENKGN